MKTIITASFLLFSTFSNLSMAAYNKVAKLQNKDLEKAALLFEKAVHEEYFGNCGSVVRLGLQDETNHYLAAVSAITGEYTESLELKDITLSEFIKSFEALTPLRDVGSLELKEIKKLKKDLSSTLLRALQTQDMRLLSGSSTSDFSGEFSSMVVIDRTHKELLAMTEGYCE